MKIIIIDVASSKNIFYEESKNELVRSAIEDAKKDEKWNTSSELTITLESFGEDIDEIICEFEFTK